MITGYALTKNGRIYKMLTIKECIEKLGLSYDKVGIRILPNERAKYLRGNDILFASANYKDCQVDCAYGKNDKIVFVVTHAEAVKHGLVKED